uniref:Protein p71 n=1 Tax=Phalaenopsis equestris Jingman-related virus TaxID=2937974 RepID=A0AAT9J7P2_9FLAV
MRILKELEEPSSTAQDNSHVNFGHVLPPNHSSLNSAAASFPNTPEPDHTTRKYTASEEFLRSLRWQGMSKSVRDLFINMPQILKDLKFVELYKISEDFLYKVMKRVGSKDPTPEQIWFVTLILVTGLLSFLYYLPVIVHFCLFLVCSYLYVDYDLHYAFSIFFLVTTVVVYLLKIPSSKTKNSLLFSIDAVMLSSTVFVISLCGLFTHLIPLNIALPLSICSLLFMLLISGVRMSQHSALAELKLTALIVFLILSLTFVFIYYNLGSIKENWHCWKYQNDADLYKRCKKLIKQRNTLELRRDEVILEVELSNAERVLSSMVSQNAAPRSWFNTLNVEFPWEIPSIGIAFNTDATWISSLAFVSFLLTCVLYFFVPVLNEFGKFTKQAAQLQYTKMNFKNPSEFPAFSVPGPFYGLLLFASDMSVWLVMLTIAFGACESSSTGFIYVGIFFAAYLICYLAYSYVFSSFYTRLGIVPLQLMSRLVAKETPMRIGTDIENSIAEKVALFIYVTLGICVATISTVVFELPICIMIGITTIITLKMKMIKAPTMTQMIFVLSIFFHFGPFTYTFVATSMLQLFLWRTENFKFVTSQTSDFYANGINEFNPQAPQNLPRARNDDLPP